MTSNIYTGRYHLMKGRREMHLKISDSEYEPRKFSDEDLNRLVRVRLSLPGKKLRKMMKKDPRHLELLHCAYDQVRSLANAMVKYNRRSEENKRLLSGLVDLLEIQI